MSRPQVQQARSRLPFQVATSWTTKPCRDANSMSRHQFPTGQVTTSVPCRDLLETNPMSRHQIHVATSHTVAHVATSNPCRDTVSAHSGISRSRRQTPDRDLPYCYPCRDLKNDVTTSTQLSPISATSRRHFSMLRPSLLPPMSRPQNDVATSSPA